MIVLISDYKRPNKKLSCFSLDFWQIIGSYNEYWFHLVTESEGEGENNKITVLAKCSVSIDYKYCQARIDDVFVPLLYRGNGYAYLLLKEVIEILKSYDMNEDVIYPIESIIVGNIPANKTYEKLFGPGEKEDDEIIFYSLNI
jgi:hypothetical protein